MRLSMLLAPKLPNSCRRHVDNLRLRSKESTFAGSRRKALTRPVQQTMILERLLHRIASCRSAAAMPTCFHPNTDRTQDMAEPVQRRSATDTQIFVIRRGESTNPTCSQLSVRLTQSWHSPHHLNMNVFKLVGLSCHVLSDHNIWYGVHVPLVSSRRSATSCFTTSCPMSPQHGRCSQGAARVLMT